MSEDDRTRLTGPADGSADAAPPAADGEATVVATSGSGPASPGAGGGAPLEPGQLLSHTYEIEALIARGGMGEVYRARHVDLGTAHAVKVILPDLVDNPKVLDLFRREAGVLRQVRSEAVVGYDGVFRDEHGRVFLVMEFAQGEPLSDRLLQGPLPVPEVLALAGRLAEGLKSAHHCQVIHRDMSPDNVILPEGDPTKAMIIDFGIAKLSDEREATILGDDFAGKFSYVSPEQLGLFGGRIGPQSDIYSTGLVLAAAAIGTPLKMGRTMAEVMAARQQVPDLARVPAQLRPLIGRMLEPDPARRFASMDEVLACLNETEPKRGSGRGRLIAIGAGVAGIAVLGLVAALLLSGGGDDPQAEIAQSGGAEAAGDRPGPDPEAALADPPPSDTAAPSEPDPAAAEPADRADDWEDPAALEALDRRIRTVLADFDCARLTHRLEPGGNLRVSGVIPKPSDHGQITMQMLQLPGISSVRAAPLTVLPPPFCRVYQDLGATLVAEGTPGAPEIFFNRQDGQYTEGDYLILEAEAGEAFDGYLYIDFIDGDGLVIHMLPFSGRPDNAARAGQRLLIGTDGVRGNVGGFEYRAVEPFGQQMLLVTQSDRPLFDRLRPQQERLDAYLAQLKQAVDAAGEQGRAPIARAAFFDIAPRS